MFIGKLNNRGIFYGLEHLKKWGKALYWKELWPVPPLKVTQPFILIFSKSKLPI
jgi:hypothetical protein